MSFSDTNIIINVNNFVIKSSSNEAISPDLDVLSYFQR